MKKVAVSFICIILLTALFSISSSGNCSVIDNNNIIYVDDDNKEGPWKGTIEHPYQYIQDGVDNASSGYTVFVFNGTYCEYVVVNETINFTGEDRDNTVIDGNIEIKSDWVNITGFTVQNSSWRLSGINVLSNYNTIHQNNIINNGEGIWLDGASYNNITGNTITDNWRRGITLSGSSNKIMGNVITNNWCAGIDLGFGSYAYNNNISKNTIRNNEGGILLWSGSENSIYGNMILYNNVCLKGSDNNSICRNNIVHGGIVLSSSSFNVIHENIITDKGISLTRGSMNNTITLNTVSNSSYGIRVTICSHNTIISSNEIIENICGIYLSVSYENKITFNNFMRNKLNAFFVNCNDIYWKSNYWDRPRLCPKPIFGIMKKWGLWIPQINFDWRPAREPYPI